MAFVNFKENPAARTKGRRVNAEEWNTISRTSEGAANVGFAEPVIRGAGPRGALPLTAAAQEIIGITEANQILVHPGDFYRQYDSMGVCEVGVIAVQVGTAVQDGQQARWNVSTKKWTAAAASATVLTVPGATFEENGGVDDVIAVRYRKPNPSMSVGA